MAFRQLMKACQKGDPRAEQQVYRLLYERLFNIPLRYTRDKDEATAAFNEGVLDLFRSKKDFKTELDLIKYATIVLKNKAIDAVRKTTVYRNKLLVFSHQSQKSHDLNEGLNQLATADIRKLIQHLPSNQRLVFVMREIEGYEYEEITRKLNINLNTARWYLAEAKKELKKRLTVLENKAFHAKSIAQ